jgi:hypothetical protein
MFCTSTCESFTLYRSETKTDEILLLKTSLTRSYGLKNGKRTKRRFCTFSIIISRIFDTRSSSSDVKFVLSG